MTSGDLENKESYFFAKNLKNIFKNDNKPLFGVGEEDPHEKSSCSTQRIVEVTGENGNREDRESWITVDSKQPSLRNVSSWKELFFFSEKDNRLIDAVNFFCSPRKQKSTEIEFSDIRKKLKQAVRHKLLKRRSIIIKNKFKRKRRFLYNKI